MPLRLVAATAGAASVTVAGASAPLTSMASLCDGDPARPSHGSRSTAASPVSLGGASISIAVVLRSRAVRLLASRGVTAAETNRSRPRSCGYAALFVPSSAVLVLWLHGAEMNRSAWSVRPPMRRNGARKFYLSLRSLVSYMTLA